MWRARGKPGAPHEPANSERGWGSVHRGRNVLGLIPFMAYWFPISPIMLGARRFSLFFFFLHEIHLLSARSRGWGVIFQRPTNRMYPFCLFFSPMLPLVPGAGENMVFSPPPCSRGTRRGLILWRVWGDVDINAIRNRVPWNSGRVGIRKA